MNTKRLQTLRAQKWYHILPVKAGQQLELHEQVGEGSNQRIWKFRWLVIKVKKPKHPDGTFTVRWKVAGVTIEKIYPLSFPNFTRVLLLDEYKVRRARLYYIRDKVWQGARMKSLLTSAEKWVDLLELAKSQAEQLQASVASTDQKQQDATSKQEPNEVSSSDQTSTTDWKDEKVEGKVDQSPPDQAAKQEEDLSNKKEDNQKDTDLE